MKKYLALLRGINVGGNHKVEMKKLRAVFEVAGFLNVMTYINSGNVIFESGRSDIEKILVALGAAIKREFKFEVPIVIRESGNIQKLAKMIPAEWKNDESQKTDILFLWLEFDNKKSLELIKKTVGVDNIAYIDGAIVWNIDRKNYNKSGMRKLIGTELYKNMTARNVNTTRKLAELMS